MEELWNLKNVLDRVDEVAIFIVSAKEHTLLYCNHYVTIKTGKHAGSSFDGVFDDCFKQINECNEDRTIRFVADITPFGPRRSVTVNAIVWEGGHKAYAFLVVPHIENSDEKDKELIFRALGNSYKSMYVLDPEHFEVTTLIEPRDSSVFTFAPFSYREWIDKIACEYLHPEDEAETRRLLEPGEVMKQLESGDYSFQVRKRLEADYRWIEFRFHSLVGADNKRKIVCTERDVHNELVVNKRNLQNEIILKSLTNVYRSVYLLDLLTGEYATVKPDELLFGIPGEGKYEEMMKIVKDFIPDDKQKKDLEEYFSVEALKNAFDSGTDNIGREYNSDLAKMLNWMSISAFRPPALNGLDDKCIITFMDITEHKRVERERNENNIALDVFASRYSSIFFVNLDTGRFHSIKVSPRYAYIEKQYANLKEAIKYYITAYVLADYRDKLLRFLCEENRKAEIEELSKEEYIFKDTLDKWIRLNIFKVPKSTGANEILVAFEECDDLYDTTN